jgi:hypothetical protein
VPKSEPPNFTSRALTQHRSGAARGVFDDVLVPKHQTEKAFFAALLSSVGAQIPILAQFLDFFERIDTKLREEKVTMLLDSFRSRFASVEDAQAHLRRLFSERAAAILTRKLVHILDRGDADEEWINLLANFLTFLSESDFEKQFEEISYALAQIDRLSPQALVLLARFESLRDLRLSGSTTTSGHTVCGDWDMQVTNHLLAKESRADKARKLRMAHAFRDLESAGLMVLDRDQVGLTPVGEEIFRHIIRR